MPRPRSRSSPSARCSRRCRCCGARPASSAGSRRTPPPSPARPCRAAPTTRAGPTGSGTGRARTAGTVVEHRGHVRTRTSYGGRRFPQHDDPEHLVGAAAVAGGHPQRPVGSPLDVADPAERCRGSSGACRAQAPAADVHRPQALAAQGAHPGAAAERRHAARRADVGVPLHERVAAPRRSSTSPASLASATAMTTASTGRSRPPTGQFWFGRNRLPGWTANAAETMSTWTAPVYGNNPGEPCHASTYANSSCTQAWRWNLDYSVDPYGNIDVVLVRAGDRPATARTAA